MAPLLLQLQVEQRHIHINGTMPQPLQALLQEQQTQ